MTESQISLNDPRRPRLIGTMDDFVVDDPEDDSPKPNDR